MHSLFKPLLDLVLHLRRLSSFVSLRIGHGGREQVVPTGVPVMPSPPEGIHNRTVDRNNVAITRSQRQTWFVFLQGSETTHYEHHFGSSLLVISALYQAMLKTSEFNISIELPIFHQGDIHPLHHTPPIVSISCWFYPHIILALWGPVLSCL